MARADLAVASPTPSPSLFLSNLTILGKMNSIKKLASYSPALFWRFWFRPSWLGYLLTWTVHELQQLWNQVHSRTKKILSWKQSYQGQRNRSLHQLVFIPESVFPIFDYSLRIVEYSSMILLISDYLFIYHLGLSLNIEHFRPLYKRQTNKGKQKWQK